MSFDISLDLIRVAHEHAVELGCAGAAYAAADARHLPFADDVFDLIVSDSTLDHFQQTSDIHLSLRELGRVLRPGGTLIVSLDNPRNITQPLMSLWKKLGLAPYFIGATLSRQELVHSLRHIGLDVVASETLLHSPRFFTKAGLRIMRRLNPPALDRLAGDVLARSEGLRTWPTCELTALFIAACAVKPQPAHS